MQPCYLHPKPRFGKEDVAYQILPGMKGAAVWNSWYDAQRFISVANDEILDAIIVPIQSRIRGVLPKPSQRDAVGKVTEVLHA
jgi:hypothetical protein